MPFPRCVGRAVAPALVCMLLFVALPVSANHPQTKTTAGGASVGITFDHDGDNEWWVEVLVRPATGDSVVTVAARPEGATYKTLQAKSQSGDWQKWGSDPNAQFRIPPGTRVQFRAEVRDQATGQSAVIESCLFTHPAGLEQCGTASIFDATFTGFRGNEWWVQANVATTGPSISKVEVRKDSGAWLPLAKQSWGATAWAASYHFPSGSILQMRATASDGQTDLSSCRKWIPPSGQDATIVTCPLAGTLPPEGVHLGTLGDLRDSITVTWRIAGEDAGQVVQFGRTTAYGSQVAATGVTPPGVTGKVYTATLSGLTADTTYHYRVGSTVSGWSSDDAFRTAPAGRLTREVRIGFTGDSGVNTQAAATMTRLDAANLDAVVHVGDHAYATTPSDWDRYFQQLRPATGESPFLAAIGNHEVESCCGLASFTSRVSLPGNEMWWSTDVGNVHVVILNSEPTTGDGHFPEDTNVFTTTSPQYQWLEDDLEAAKLTGRYLVVAFHRPIYSSNTNHPSNPGMRDVLEPLFDRMDVDLVMNGHAHNYERSYPLEGGVRTTTDLTTYTKGEGTIHLITGGGGRPLYDSWQTQPAWSAKRASVHEWVELVAGTDGSLKVIARRTNEGTVLDSFTIWPEGTTASAREAEAFAIKTAGGKQAQSTASAGAVWNLWSNGHIQDSVGSTAGGNLVVQARGQPLGGVWPTMVVSVDGTVVKTVSVSSTALTPYSIGPVIAGTHTVKVAFTNDAASSTEDRNLILDVVRVTAS